MTRCAIYTRKSHEEGLDQVFNSLDAQREAGLDYIRSQKHEGWRAIDTLYDDGGYSGGTMERPGLQRLLADIECGRIDVVVVYKVDRLSRSLHDFARMMQVFDQHRVSFVSVTQQFNTTTSMGRLTLNMLLSFAQFEREVTGERIRDKLAATKKKGLWVTGQPPLGYRSVEQELRIVPEEAAMVRAIYEGYLENPSLMELSQRLSADGHTTKHWCSSRGRWHGGCRLTSKYIYRVLTNPIYVGKITHKGKVWPGRHEPIVAQSLWDRVQTAIEGRNHQARHRWSHTHLLKGKIKTGEGYTLSPSAVHQSTKTSGQKRLVRYYVSQKAIRQGCRNCSIKTLNAQHVDELVRALVLDYLRRHEAFNVLHSQEPQISDHWLRVVIGQVVVAPDQLTLELDAAQIEACKADEELRRPSDRAMDGMIPTCLYQPRVEQRGKLVVLTLAIQIKRLDGRRLLLSPDGHDLFMPTQPQPRPHLVTAIAQAYRWKQELEQRQLAMNELADQLTISTSLIRKYLPLIYLAPDILRRVLTGQLPPSVTLQNLLDAAQHLDWSRQRRYLRLDVAPVEAA